MYNFHCFDKVSAIRKPKIMMFSITDSQIFFMTNMTLFIQANEKLIHTTGISSTLVLLISVHSRVGAT